MSLPAADILAAARLRVASRHPYILACLFTLRPVPLPGLGTMGVDAGWRLWYDPDIVKGWGAKATAAVLAHEVWHCLRDHAGRQRGRDKMLWNVACDAAINDDIRSAGWELPGKCVYPETVGVNEGMLEEEIYDRIAKRAKQLECRPCGGCCGNPQGEHEQESDGVSAPGATDGPSSSDGDRDDRPEPVAAFDQSLARQAVAQAVTEAVKSKGRGTVPAGLAAWAEVQLAPPRVDWRRRLAGLVRQATAYAAGAIDFTFKRPARKQSALGRVVVPAVHAPVPTVVIVLDTSGSMLCGDGQTPIEAALGEVLGIVRAVGAPVTVLATDAAVQATVQVRGKAEIGRLNKGGGGTDMCVGIEEAIKRRPDVVVVLTDGATPWPEPGRHRTKVIAAITPGGAPAPAHILSVTMEE